jgi:hypothetical protein
MVGLRIGEGSVRKMAISAIHGQPIHIGGMGVKLHSAGVLDFGGLSISLLFSS